MRSAVVKTQTELSRVLSGKLQELIRENKPVPQRQLAKDIGIPTMVLNRAINAGAMPTAETVKLIAVHYGVSTDWLLGVEGAPKKRRLRATA